MLTHDDSPQDHARTTVVMVVEGGGEVPVRHLDPARAPDLVLVDALMRLQLAARRRGWQVGVRGATDELRGLLDLVGLPGVLLLDGAEALGQPELGEERCPDEVVQPGDAPV